MEGGSGATGGLGSRLRRERLQQEIGLRELARRIGVSASLISQIESGKSEPSVSTLSAIVTELDLSLNEIVFDETARSASRRRHDEQAEELRQPLAVRVQKASVRRSIHLSSDVTWERLTADPDPEVDFLYVTYAVGGASSDRLMRHAGREYGYVIAGQLRVSIGFDDFDLGPGDSIAFDSTAPHRLVNIGEEPVLGIWTVVGRGTGARRSAEPA